MNKQKRNTITAILVVIGIMLLFSLVLGRLPMDVTYDGPIGEIVFTGIDATILTIGIVLLLFAYFIYYKKLPWLK